MEGVDAQPVVGGDDERTDIEDVSPVPDSESAEQADGLPASQELSKTDLYNVVISSANGSLKQIKAIREVTLPDLKSAQSVISSLPYAIAESQDELTAKKIKAKLELAGIGVDLIPL